VTLNILSDTLRNILGAQPDTLQQKSCGGNTLPQ